MLDLRKNLIERRMIDLDPDWANHYLNYNDYEVQRDVRITHVKDLSSKMKRGIFRFGELGFAVMNGRDIMLNGQHVCYAVIDSGVIVPCVFERFRIDNKRELSEAFRQFEILPRSLQDMIKVEASSLKLAWPIRLSSLIVAAATLEVVGHKRLTSGSGTSKFKAKTYLSKDDKVKLLGEYLQEGNFLYRVLFEEGKKTRGKHLFRASVVLIMMKTWRINQEDAFGFWCRVRDGENLTINMPEMKLREFLLQTRQLIRPSAYAARPVTPHEYAYRCIQAWNAFREGRKTRISYYPDKALPKLK